MEGPALTARSRLTMKESGLTALGAALDPLGIRILYCEYYFSPVAKGCYSFDEWICVSIEKDGAS